MIETFLSLFGISQNFSKHAEDRRLHAGKLLASAHAHILETEMLLDHEIQRIEPLCKRYKIPKEIALQSLITMQQQCKTLKQMHDEQRTFLATKGANAKVIIALEEWVATLSVMPRQVELGSAQIENTMQVEYHFL